MLEVVWQAQRQTEGVVHSLALPRFHADEKFAACALTQRQVDGCLATRLRCPSLLSIYRSYCFLHIFNELNRLDFIGRNIHAAGVLYQLFSAILSLCKDMRNKEITLVVVR